MLLCIFYIHLICALWETCHGQANDHGNTSPLILTPFLEKGDIEGAQKASSVHIGDVVSYSGYFTVNKDCGNNLFFWFFQAEVDWEHAAVILWINGGPGVSSLFALFEENGVWKFGFEKRKYHWSQKFNVLYIDQPAGSGYSFSEKTCYPKDSNAAAKELVSALFQFFKLFPVLQSNKFFLTGESYAGHFLPATAMEIDKENEKAKVKINLLGMVIANPWLEARCMNTANYLYDLGIIDFNARDNVQRSFDDFVKAINAKNYKKALEIETSNLRGGYVKRAQLPSRYNVLYDIKDDDDPNTDNYTFYVRDYELRKLIHVGLTPFAGYNSDVFDALYVNDAYVSILPTLEYLLKTNKYIIGFVSGQLDLVCLYTSLPCALRQLNWPGASLYHNATRSTWFVGDRLAGWVKVAGNLFEIAVRNSGHYVSADQGDAALQLLSAVVAGQPGKQLLTGLKLESD